MSRVGAAGAALGGDAGGDEPLAAVVVDPLAAVFVPAAAEPAVVVEPAAGAPPGVEPADALPDDVPPAFTDALPLDFAGEPPEPVEVPADFPFPAAD